ncbi:MAG TPA: M48 family metalloprotease [Thermoanaerobaculia bacterium]
MSFARRTLPLLTLLPLLALLAADRAAAQTIQNPDLFAKSVEAAQEALIEYGPYDNPAELERVNRIGYELAQQADFQKFPFTFALVNMPEPDAFSLPAGQVFVSRGLLDLGLDDDMLANILGHEIGHVIKEHYLHMQRRATLMNVLSNVLMAGVIVGENQRKRTNATYDPRLPYDQSDYGGNLIQGAAAASLVMSELLLRSYSRENEDESDVVGQRLASAAGYDPEGAQRTWQVMEKKAPQIREYGYLQTHPFSIERMKAAEARKGMFTIQPHSSAEAFRRRTQAVLVTYAETHKPKEKEGPGGPDHQAGPGGHRGGGRGPHGEAQAEMTPEMRERQKRIELAKNYLTDMALNAWPQGRVADGIRLARLHTLRDRELHKQALNRDYGALLRPYRKTLDEVKSVDPKSELIATLNGEIADLDTERKGGYAHAVEVLNGGVYETSFLVGFLSNYPDAKETPRVALALGDAYSRLGDTTEAVTQYLTAWQSGPETAEGKRARTGLRVLAPSVKQLAALQQLVDQDKDAEIKNLAADRLATMAKTYDDLANGAEYLRRYPDGPQVVPVLDRLNTLADNLYGEVVLYQGFGDAAKAVERINKILTNAPLSPAAARLRDKAVIADKAAG